MSAELEAIAQELDSYTGPRVLEKEAVGKRLYSLDSDDCHSFATRSELWGRCVARELFVLEAGLTPPGRHASTWPHAHSFVAAPELRSVSDHPLGNAEAVGFYAARAALAAQPFLKALFADHVFLCARDSRRSTHGLIAVEAYLDYFEAHTGDRRDARSTEATWGALRALEIALRLPNTAERDRVVERAARYVEDNLLKHDRVVHDLILGIAHLDRRRELLPYAEYRDRLEKWGEDTSNTVDGSVRFGFARSVARLARNEKRELEVARKHATSALEYARSKAAEPKTAGFAYQVASTVHDDLGGLPDVDDLRRDAKRVIDSLEGQIFANSVPQSFSLPLTAETVAEHVRTARLIREAGEGWATEAVMFVLSLVPVREDVEDAVRGNPFSGIVTNVQVHGAHIASGGEAWQHAVSGGIELMLSPAWNNTLRPALRGLLVDGNLTVESAIAIPAQVVRRSEARQLICAAQNLLGADYVAALQQWALLAETIVRRLVLRSGGSPTALELARFGTRERPFEVKLDELEEVVKQKQTDSMSALYWQTVERALTFARWVFAWPSCGLNLRNNVAHALLHDHQFTADAAYLAFFACAALCGLDPVFWPSGSDDAEEEPSNDVATGALSPVRDELDSATSFAATSAMGSPRLSWHTVLIETDGEWLVGTIEEYPGVFSQGRTEDELMDNLADALRETIAAHRERAEKAASPTAQRRQLVVSLPPSGLAS